MNDNILRSKVADNREARLLHYMKRYGAGHKNFKDPAFKEKVKRLKKVLGMGGFLEEKALRELELYYNPVVMLLLKAKVPVDKEFQEKLERVCEIFDAAYAYYDEFIEVNNYSSELNDEHLCVRKNEFIIWYIGQTIDYLYGKDRFEYEDYFLLEKEFIVDECIGSAERNIAYGLNPVEFMFYMASQGVDENLNWDQEKRSAQLDINRDFVRLVDNYVAETVKNELKRRER